MNYPFPTITCLADVLPAIQEFPEFIVVDKGDYIVVNYAMKTDKTFNMTGPDDILGAIRRECRGLIFYPDGRIMSRPFHKFFNVDERPETQATALNMGVQHVVLNKLDGSFIRPVLINGGIRLGTKMGVTGVSILAETYATLE